MADSSLHHKSTDNDPLYFFEQATKLFPIRLKSLLPGIARITFCGVARVDIRKSFTSARELVQTNAKKIPPLIEYNAGPNDVHIVNSALYCGSQKILQVYRHKIHLFRNSVKLVTPLGKISEHEICKIHIPFRKYLVCCNRVIHSRVMIRNVWKHFSRLWDAFVHMRRHSPKDVLEKRLEHF